MSTIFGGYLAADENETPGNSGTVSKNTVTINGGTGIAGCNIYGGYASSWDSSSTTAVDDNAVILNGGNYSEVSIYGGQTNSYYAGEANGNTVTVNGGTWEAIYGGWSTPGVTDVTNTVNGNKITVNGGSISHDVCGGFSNSGSVDSNIIIVNDGTVSGGIAGGELGGNGSVNKNIITVNGGTVSGGIDGGLLQGSGSVSNNEIILNGGTVSGDVYAGVSTLSSQATNNTVTIQGTADLDLSNATLYGSTATHGRDLVGDQLGNTLNVYRENITAKNIANFSNINFYLPSSIQNKDTVLTLTDTAGTDISYSTVKAGVAGNAKLSKGDTIYLLTNTNGLTTTGTSYGKLTEGVSLDYDLDVHQDGNSIVATIDSAPSGGNGDNGGNGNSSGLKYQTKSLVETRAAEIEFLNSGMNLASGMVMDDDLSTAEGTYVPFAATSGDIMRYQTGSHVDIRGDHTIVGLSRKIDKKDGAVYIAPFIEGGWGRYTSHMGDITANGNLNYYGFGVLAHRQHDSGLYYEGSLHYGRVQSTYNSDDLEGAANEHYDLTTPYYAVYAGIGKEKKSKNGNRINIYGKYYYTREQGDTTTLRSGETYDFNNVTSNRVRLGTRYTHAYGSRGETYAGIAYEYEFSGGADATYKGYHTPDSRLKGGSGMLEVGYKILPTKDRPVSLDITLTGWVGRQSGIIPAATVKWHF